MQEVPGGARATPPPRSPTAFGFGVQGSGFRVWGVGCGVRGLWFGVWGLKFEVWGLGFRVEGLEFVPWREAGPPDHQP